MTVHRAALLIIIITASSALLPSFRAAASTSAAALYQRGNELYQEGKFEKAREAYSQALATGMNNAALYFNIGNAELRSGRLGPAILNYMRAQRIRPRDLDIKFNLEYARARIAGRPEQLPTGPFTRAFNYVVELMSANEWTALIIGVYWLLGAAWAAGIVADRTAMRRASRAVVYACFGLIITTLPFGGVRIKRDYFTPRAVMTVEKITARSGPGEGNAALFELYEGVDVVVGQCEVGWCRVSAQGGFIGWVKADSFERL